jgi:pimeloyl-ACP methyl ester carboxylesterase
MPNRTFSVRRRTMPHRTLIALLLISIGSPSVAQSTRDRPASARYAGKLAPCTVAGVDTPVLCGHHEVFEDRVAGRGRTIALNIVVLPATTDSVLDDPLVYLAGGGVVPATPYAARFARTMTRLRLHRDIVLVDQRGSGGSNGLACDRRMMDMATARNREERYLEFVAMCRDTLASHADVRFYTTALAMDDLDDVRQWLGYSRINIQSTSYGTSAAQVYMRNHPTRVRAVVMHGVVPVDAPMAADLAQSAQQSLDQVLRLCRADARCREAFPDLASATSRVLAPPDTGMSRVVRNLLNDLLTSANSMREIPFIIESLARGDSSVLEPPPMPAEPPAAAAFMGPPLGVRLAILCSEGLHRIDVNTLDARTAGTFLGAVPVRFQMRWCEHWPRADIPEAFFKPVVSDIPTLLLNGELDAVTPPSYAEHVKAGLSNGQVVLLPNRSHADVDPCVFATIEAFVMDGGRSRVDSACLKQTTAIDFKLGR